MGARPRPRLTGETRLLLAQRLSADYSRGLSIRDLARSHSLSITLTRTLLASAGVQPRSRGGYQRRPAP